MSTESLRTILVRHWRPIALYGGLFAFLAGLLAWRLGTLLPGYTQQSLEVYQSSLHLNDVLHNPINAPFSLLAYAVSLLHSHHSLLYLRMGTAAMAFAVLVIFCLLLRHWHSARTAFFGTLLLGTSSAFLHTARMGTPVILMFGLFALVACGVWLRTTNSRLAVVLGLLLAALLVYVPGMVWLIGLGLVWQWKAVDSTFKKHLGAVTLGGLLFVGLLAPLVLGLFKHPALSKQLLNMPAQGWPNPFTVLHNLINVPLHIFVRGGSDGATVLSQVPMLDFFSTAMFLLGGYLYLRYIGLHRSNLLIAIFLAGAGVISLGGTATAALLLPFLYVVIAVGVNYMFEQWFAVFPRNPIAQGVGLVAVGFVVTLACAYHLRLYFVAWPQASDTQGYFTVHEP
jgi:hypothetical protein